jgi:hypothetical protein
MVIHTARVVGDGVTRALTVPRVHAVMRPKADAAWHPHELVRDIHLQAFVLFSSVAAPFGGSGQGNYAAANAPSLRRGLVRARPAAGGSPAAASSPAPLKDQLAALPPAHHGPFVLDLITPPSAAVLGYTTPAQIEPGREFHDLGFDSLTATSSPSSTTNSKNHEPEHGLERPRKLVPQ